MHAISNRLLGRILRVLLVAPLGATAHADNAPRAAHGAAAGDVTASTAVIWSRADRPALMTVTLQPAPPGGARSIEVSAVDDYTGQIPLRGLQPATRYHYEVSFEAEQEARSQAVAGNFTTAPVQDSTQTVKIAWTGDFAGQNVCRDARDGFPIFRAIAAEQADLFVGLGDMIYADNVCKAVGAYGNPQIPGDFLPSADLPSFWAHWRYNRADTGFQQLLASTPYYGVWDDHEVVNDFGPQNDVRTKPPYTPGTPLLPMGLKAFLDYTPLARDPADPNRLYRNVRWGRHVELFFLDNRQYRDPNLAADDPDRAKSMLGARQLNWLKQAISGSNATWKIIVSSVPMSIPTGSPASLGRDGWGNDDAERAPTVTGIPQSDTGFERELLDILRALQQARANAMFITTDVHFAEVFRYTPFADAPDFHVHEVATGPGNAGIFPNRSFDTTLGTESLFFFGPKTPQAVTSWQVAKTWFNYGTLEKESSGHLTARVKDTAGTTVYTLRLTPR